MSTQRRWPALFMLVSLAAVTGCGRAAVPGGPTPGATAHNLAPSTPDAELPADVLAARNAVLGYLATQFPKEGPQEGMVWTGTSVTPPGLVGATHYQFESGEWSVYVVKPVTAPDQVVYHVSVKNAATGFVWKGLVNTKGQVQEDQPMAPSSQVQGWMGRVLSLPSGSEQVD